MVGPLPVTPLSKAIIVDAGDHFETGTFSWLAAARPHGSRTGCPIAPNEPGGPGGPRERNVRALLGWSRFPYFDVTPAPDGLLVTFTDLRFGARIGRTTVLVPR